MDIIEIKSKLHDFVEKADSVFLRIVHVMVEQYFYEQTASSTKPIDTTKKISKLAQAATTTRSNVSFTQLIKEQNYQPITYQEWRSIADEIEWEASLEELLAAAK